MIFNAVIEHLLQKIYKYTKDVIRITIEKKIQIKCSY